MTAKVAIVDAYSSGRLLAPLFQKSGIQCVHVQSSMQIPEVYRHSYQPEDFSLHLSHDGNLNRTLDQLRAAKVQQVVAGIESGVELADQLSESLGCLSNGTELSEARRDKFKMIQVLQTAGLRTIPSILTSSVDSALQWVGQKCPVVCKPKKSAGTDDVLICHREEDIRNAFIQILGKKNRLDLMNEDVLVQQFVLGTEYIVDVVVSSGYIVPAAIYQYEKVPQCGSMIYDTVRLLPFEGQIQSILFSYAKQVVKALGIDFGPAHLEIMMTEQGPVLIEMGARLDGADAPILQQKCIGTDQAELTVQCYFSAKAFQLRQSKYRLNKHLLRVKLICEQEGVLREFRYLDLIKKLKSFYRLTQIALEGKYLPKTSNLFDLPGIVDLVHEDEQVIQRDYQLIRSLEKQGMYVFEKGEDTIRIGV